jgi:hypothetical protein
LQLVADTAPSDAPAPVTLPLINGGDAAAPVATNAAGPQIPARLNALPAFASLPPAAPIAFHSTAELNFRGSAPQAPAVAAAGIPAETQATPIPVTNMPAAEAKPQEEKSSTPVSETRVEHKHHAHVEKTEATAEDTPDAQPQPASAVQLQPAAPALAPVPAPTGLPVNMVLPIAARFNRPLIPLGNRIPVAAFAATRTPVRTEAPAAADPSDPFNSDAAPKAATLPAEATQPLVATADQLAFATKVQLSKPQAIQRHAAPVQAEPVQAAPVHSESHSQQQQQSSHRDADQQLSTKAGETAAKPVIRAAHAASTFEAAPTVSEDHIPAAKPGLTGSTRPASAAAAAAEDVTPTRPELPAAPMKDISVRIQSEQGENVDIRILHRAGDVQIAVKSASGETTQGLRHGLSELSDRLNATGFHADTWHSGQTTTAAENNADSGNSQNSQQQQSQGDSQSHSGWSQQQRGQRDDNQNNRPRWIEELESNISSSPETGLFHGLIR